MLKQQFILRYIAKTIGVSFSTVSREPQRNSHQGIYQPEKAEILMRECYGNRKCHQVFTKEMRQYIDDHLRSHQWSPEQIVGRCRLEGIPMPSVSRIYLHGDKGGTLYKHCRHHLKYLKIGLAFRGNTKQGRKAIQDRPEIITEQRRMGDFEMELFRSEWAQSHLNTRG